MSTKTKFTHIINPVLKPKTHELMVAQPITYRSIENARSYFKSLSGHSIQLVCAVYDEDRILVPKNTSDIIYLIESFRDVVNELNAPKLPLMRELITKTINCATSEYIIYTNIDIALMPNFYSVVTSYLNSGYDNIVINRRTIHPNDWEMESLDVLQSFAGEIHPGYDCFVFKTDIAGKFNLGDLAIGLPGFDWAMVLNMWYRGEKGIVMSDRHLTFHIGDDKKWMSNAMRQWQEMNYQQLLGPLEVLRAEFGEREHFIWPRPVTKRSLITKIMNKLGRSIVRRWPNQ